MRREHGPAKKGTHWELWVVAVLSLQQQQVSASAGGDSTNPDEKGLRAPSAPGWFSGACTSWSDSLLHNAICKDDSAYPNSGPCCNPVETDRRAADKLCGRPAVTMPCPSCLDKCTEGTGREETILVAADVPSLAACKVAAEGIRLPSGRRCLGVTWVHPPQSAAFGGKCFCATVLAAYATATASGTAQVNVDSSACMSYTEPGWWVVLVAALGGGLYVGGGVQLGRRARAGAGGGASALSAHPHFSWWQYLHGLCQDGVRFVQQTAQGHPRTANHQTIARLGAAEPLILSGGGRSRSGSDAKSSSAGSQRSSRSKKERSSDKTDKRSKRTEQSTPAESSEQGNDLGWSGGGAAAGALAEQRDAVAHSSQQKIKVVVNQASS